MKINKLYLSGVRIDHVDIRSAIEAIEGFISEKAKQQVCVTNTYSLVLMKKDEEFKRINNNCGLVVADGMPLVWTFNMLGHSMKERVAGPDLFNALCDTASEKGYTFYFLGATQGKLDMMVENLDKSFPKLRVAGTYSPPFKPKFSEEENKIMINKINEAKPDILWVGMTAPKQEKWIDENLSKLNVGAAIGIGAAFDFIAGTVKRSPLFLQKCGMEWSWRLFQEPGRLWKRYLIGNTNYLYIVFKELIYRLFRKI